MKPKRSCMPSKNLLKHLLFKSVDAKIFERLRSPVANVNLILKKHIIINIKQVPFVIKLNISFMSVRVEW